MTPGALLLTGCIGIVLSGIGLLGLLSRQNPAGLLLSLAVSTQGLLLLLAGIGHIAAAGVLAVCLILLTAVHVSVLSGIAVQHRREEIADDWTRHSDGEDAESADAEPEDSASRAESGNGRPGESPNAAALRTEAHPQSGGRA